MVKRSNKKASGRGNTKRSGPITLRTEMTSSAARPMCIDEVLWDENGWPYFRGGTPSISHVSPSVFR